MFSTNFSFKTIFSILLVLAIALPACNDDDEASEMSVTPPTVYDASKHIYATVLAQDMLGSEEIIIDVASGVFGRIAASQRELQGLDLPLGTRNLTDFVGNKRIALENEVLLIEDLATYEQKTIDLGDPALGIDLVNPQQILFGATNNELFIRDVIHAVWKVNLLTEAVELVVEDLSFEGQLPTYLFYSAADDNLIFAARGSASNNPTSNSILRYDLAMDTIINQNVITESFGFVMHPDDERIFALTTTDQIQGFRLLEFQYSFGQLAIRPVSQMDLAIDELSFYMQTIHSETNAYICRGGSNNIESPTNKLYSINLDNGELVSTVELAAAGTMLKLAGE